MHGHHSHHSLGTSPRQDYTHCVMLNDCVSASWRPMYRTSVSVSAFSTCPLRNALLIFVLILPFHTSVSALSRFPLNCPLPFATIPPCKCRALTKTVSVVATLLLTCETKTLVATLSHRWACAPTPDRVCQVGKYSSLGRQVNGGARPFRVNKTCCMLRACPYRSGLLYRRMSIQCRLPSAVGYIFKLKTTLEVRHTHGYR